MPIRGPIQSLQAWDPDRYGSLSHPGDAYSYDIFAQVAAALRKPSGVNPLAESVKGLGHPKLGYSNSGRNGSSKIRTVLAYGNSQSASRLTTYTNALQNRDQVFDGIPHP